MGDIEILVRYNSRMLDKSVLPVSELVMLIVTVSELVMLIVTLIESRGRSINYDEMLSGQCKKEADLAIEFKTEAS